LKEWVLTWNVDGVTIEGVPFVVWNENHRDMNPNSRLHNQPLWIKNLQVFKHGLEKWTENWPVVAWNIHHRILTLFSCSF